MKNYLLLFTVIGLFVSCTVKDNRTFGFGNPNCPFCHGEGFVVQTSFLVFNTYNNCICKYKHLPIRNNSNISFRGSYNFSSDKAAFIREVDVYIYQNGEYKYAKRVDLWKEGTIFFVIDGSSSYIAFNPSNSPYRYAYGNEWGYYYYFD